MADTVLARHLRSSYKNPDFFLDILDGEMILKTTEIFKKIQQV